jgi:chromate transporter
MKEVLLLFYAFAKVGILGYGGGQSIIPLIQVEVVDNYQCFSWTVVG